MLVILPILLYINVPSWVRLSNADNSACHEKLSEKVVNDVLRYAFAYDASKVFDRFIR